MIIDLNVDIAFSSQKTNSFFADLHVGIASFGKWSSKINLFKTQSQNAIPQYKNDIPSARNM
jgi:hypothetical protein